MKAGWVLAGAMLLAGCGSDAEKAPDDERGAAGEVLGGSISDDMLPLDTRRSVSPAVRAQPSPGAAVGARGSGSDAPAEGAAEPADADGEAEAPATAEPDEDASDE